MRKFFALFSALVWFALWLGTAACGETLPPVRPGALLIERFPATLYSGDLTTEAVQQLGLEMGVGQFEVRAGSSASPPMPGSARIFFVYASREALGRDEPMKRFFYSGFSAGKDFQLRSADDGELVTFLLEARSGEGTNDVALVRLLPEVLLVALYDGRARLWGAEGEPSAKAAGGKTPGRPSTTPGEALAPPEFSRDESGRRIWRGCFAVESGGVEAVAVTLPREKGGTAAVERKTVRAPGFYPAAAVKLVGVETWLVAARTGWHPSQRYQLRIALAAMRHDPRSSYSLGAALWREQDDGARIEGIKWLKAAAADGYPDAVTLLADIGAGSIRAVRNREIERKEK